MRLRGSKQQHYGRDVSGAHTEASHPCFMMLASDFSRDALENRARSFQAPAHEEKKTLFLFKFD